MNNKRIIETCIKSSVKHKHCCGIFGKKNVGYSYNKYDLFAYHAELRFIEKKLFELGFDPTKYRKIWKSDKRNTRYIQQNKKELDTIKRKLSKIKLVVIRWNGHRFTNSKPCNNCLNYMKYLGLKKICFSSENGELTHVKLNSFNSNHVCKSVKNILHY